VAAGAQDRRLDHLMGHSDRPRCDRFCVRADGHLCAPRQRPVRSPHPRNRRGSKMTPFSTRLVLAALALTATLVSADCALAQAAAAQKTNYNAVVMFLAFVAVTLVITYWAARRTKSAADFYAASGGITGFQNGLAIAGDYMSAASFLGI